MSRVLALDIGSQRIGTALTDESQIIASPHELVSFGNWEEEIKKILAENDIELLVIGLPRRMNGSLGEKAKEIMLIGEKMEKVLGLKVEYEDETATSVEAERRLKERGVDIRKNKGLIDVEAAAIILESYLNRKDVE